ncbi:hypothetical protein GCM10022393_07560 [Aquimarina addita]|uniref:DUF3108 domain-containing protein n=1 Tax=Aquimarina addita TaxID=870485 RepID=A0ABP7XBG7_9FLAO
MKNLLYTCLSYKVVLLFIGFTGTLNAQNNCSQFYPSEIGKTMILHHYNHKNKLSSKTAYSVANINSSGSKTEITMNMDLIDGKRNNSISKAEFKITCDGETTYLDPESIISPQLFSQYEGMEYTIDGTDISIPNLLTVGQELPDGQVTMSVNVGGMGITMDIKLLNRTVTAKENIRTNAGSFDCYLIEYTNETKMSMGIRQTLAVKQWIAKDAGLVKQETRKQNGKLMTKSILEQYN